MRLSNQDEGNQKNHAQKEDVSVDGVPTKLEPPTLAQRLRHRVRSCLDRVLPGLAVPTAVLVGGGIFAGTTYAVVQHVNHLIATAAVDANPTVWIETARTQAYDACYFGCIDCGDPNFAYNACAMTARGNVTGVVCDGNVMWNWAERYPAPCLAAVGEIYKEMALAGVKKHYRNQLAIIVVTFVAGVLGGWATYKIWRRLTRRRRERHENSRRYAQSWPASWHAYHDNDNTTTTTTPRASRRRVTRTKKLFAFTWLAALLGRGANAYACTGYDPAAGLYFASANGTVSGLIYGWFSNCYDYSCDCIASCSGSSSSSGCSITCSTCTTTDKTPADYVNATLPRIQACGFQVVDHVNSNVSVRVANGGIESNWWVKIAVNGYNVTIPTETDESVLCLHSIGNM